MTLSAQAFALRLYRQGNQSGFIRALTDHPEALLPNMDRVLKAGIFVISAQTIRIIDCTIHHRMQALWLRKIHLWPRFEASIISALYAETFLARHDVTSSFSAAHAPKVEEIRVPMTPAMMAIQQCLAGAIPGQYS